MYSSVSITLGAMSCTCPILLNWMDTVVGGSVIPTLSSIVPDRSTSVLTSFLPLFFQRHALYSTLFHMQLQAFLEQFFAFFKLFLFFFNF